MKVTMQQWQRMLYPHDEHQVLKWHVTV